MKALTKIFGAAAVCAVLGMVQAPAVAAVVVTFERITSNNVEDLKLQLSLTIFGASDVNPYFARTGMLATNQVLMVLQNNVGIRSSISEFYIDNGPILTGPTVFNSLSGLTNFANGSTEPGNLPGHNTINPAFVADTVFSVDADGNPNNGINAAADALGLMYTTANPLTDIISGLADGSLRFGLHVRSIGAADGSDSYVNVNGSGGTGTGTGGNGTGNVPEPATLALVGLALLGAATARRRRV